VAASDGRNALLRLLTGNIIPGLITASPVPVLVVKEARRKKASARSAVAPLKPRGKQRAAAAAPMQRSRRAQV